MRIAKSELKVAENELSKALAITFEEWQADCREIIRVLRIHNI